MRAFCSTILFIFIYAIFHPATVFGAEMCVSTPNEFQTALSQAAQNEEDDLIKVQQGTYARYELSYNSTKDHSIALQGGYTRDCRSRQLNPANTILEGGSVDHPLTMISRSNGDITVDGFTIQNGKSASNGGGLYLLSDDDIESGNITVTNCIIVSSTGQGNGGGIYALSESNPDGIAGSIIISNNTISNNQALGQPYIHGGGIYASSYSFDGSSGDVTVTGNTVTGNTSAYGGGIWAWSYGPVGPGNVTITDNFVKGNTATGGNAGGIYAGSHAVTAGSGTVTISRNTVLENATSGGLGLGKGGGLYAETSSALLGDSGDVLLSGNIIKGNNAQWGGGVYAITKSSTQNGGAVRLYDNSITGNTTERTGGGIDLFTFTTSGTAGDIILANNIIAGNRTGGNDPGGGAWLRSYTTGAGTAGTMTFTGNTVTANRANGGSGFHIRLENNAARFYNNVFRNNNRPLGWDLDFDGTGTTSAYNNNLDYVYGSWTNSGNNIDLNSKFINPGAWSDNSTPSNPFDDTWLGGNFHLRADSPCIDAGMNSAPEIQVHDFEGDPRIIDGDNNGSVLTDIGADEFVRKVSGTTAIFLILWP